LDAANLWAFFCAALSLLDDWEHVPTSPNAATLFLLRLARYQPQRSWQFCRLYPAAANPAKLNAVLSYAVSTISE